MSEIFSLNEFPWFAAAEEFAQRFGSGVAWSTSEGCWYARTWFEGSGEMAWVKNGRFVMDLWPIKDTRDLAAGVHVARMLLARSGDPDSWEPEPHRDNWSPRTK